VTAASEYVEKQLLAAFEQGLPVVAFLGQGVTRPEVGQDPVLGAALRKVGRETGGWKALISSPLDPSIYSWMSERYAQEPVYANLLSIADAPLSAVYTSSVDPRLRNLFETAGREPDTVLVGDPPPAIRRSRRRPPFYLMFGRAGDTVAEFQPPASTSALARRRMLHASPMARTILDTATALGLVVVDGFEPSDDWFRSEDLLALLADAPIGGVIWFGPSPEFSGDDQLMFADMVERGIVLLDDRRLGRVLAKLALERGEPFEQRWDDAGVISFADGKKLLTSPSLRLATEASATIIDDAFTAFLPPVSNDDLASEFRSFHAVSTSARSLVSGIRRGFAIQRTFEDTLARHVNRAILRHHEEAGAIIVHGQSGVGKSIALARLAYRLRENKSTAVLYSLNSFPQPVEVADFLAAVDSQDQVTVILADASVAIHRYDDLLDALRSRGHRVVVVGTTYKQDGALNSDRARAVEAPSQLDTVEQGLLAALTKEFIPDSTSLPPSPNDQFALAGFFYRLPASRVRISEGLGREARHVGIQIARQGSAPKPTNPVGSLGEALVEAGFPAPTSTILGDESTQLGDWGSETAANRLIDYVMVSARLYKWVPINLLLRAVGNRDDGGRLPIDLNTVRDLFEGHDLFRWRLDDDEGQELLVGARLQLEAELICNRRLGGAAGEATRLAELVSAGVRAGGEANSETRFLVDLVYAFGPDGPSKERYSNSYADFARALTTLRVEGGVENARLMLQEATLRRSYVRLHETDATFKLALLDEAREAVDLALSRAEGGGQKRLYASRRTIDNLWVERAATYGFMATDAAEHQQNSGQVWSSYQAARNAVRKASGRVDSYFPLDIALWLPARILKIGQNLTDAQTAELEADIRHTLELVDPTSLDQKQFEIFQRQKLSCSEVLQDEEISSEAFERLREAGSTAGYYLRARRLAPMRPERTAEATPDEVEKAAVAKAYLWNSFAEISNDIRCLQLLLSCEWVVTTGRWLFNGQRQPLPNASEQRQRIWQLLTEMLSVSTGDIQAKYRYLEAVMGWLVDDERTAIEHFRALASETEFVEGGRVFARHEISDSSGRAKLFSGTALTAIGGGRWRVRVEELNRSVDLIAADFKSLDIVRGTTIRNFSIAFNYLGPLARPATTQ